MLAAPVILVFAALALAGLLSPLAAFVAGAALLTLSLLLLWWHLRGLSRLSAYLRRAVLDDGQRPVALEAPGTPALHPDSHWDPSRGLAPRTGLAALDEIARAVDQLRRRETMERRALAEALLAAERIPDALPDPLLVLDSQRRVVLANRRAREMFSPGLGQDLAYSIRHPQVLDMVTAVLEQNRVRGEVEFEVGDPERVFGAQCVRYGNEPGRPPGLRPAPGGPAAILVLHEVTALKRAEQMRADFVANASHELKTPLASLIGFIETLRGPARDDGEARERFLAIMAGQADRMARLVQDLLSLSQIELNEYSPPTGRVDLAVVARRVAKAQQVNADARKVRLAVVAQPGLPLVQGDHDQIEQILQNLVDNAIKYGREGGLVEIAVQSAEGVDPKSGSSADGGHTGDVAGRRAIAVAVSDQGNGIQREHIPRLTERFYRVDQARSRALGGTGLGLAIVKHIVNRHRGTLTIRSVQGIGSTFTVTLPAVGGGNDQPDPPGVRGPRKAPPAR